MSNSLTRSMDRIPSWIVQAIVGIVLSSGVAWASWATVTSMKHETRISVVETKADNVKDDIVEIKDGQKEMNNKLDRLIERRR